ncbi:hypothetical protein [Sphingorhabdus sp.]|uniref:hypothetical protein n=1 Tax=Sphingorhabdus sp. TaxID=1902408 RepID=UPI00391ADAA7
MEQFFASGRAVDVVLAVLVVEALWLRLRGQQWVDISPALLPAILMMLGLRAALTGMDWPFISFPLALAFPVHLYDMHRRRMLQRKP